MLRTMKINVKIQLTYDNSKNSKMVYDSLEIDNEGFVESDLNEEIINYTINSETLGSFLATADDLIASEIVVEKILNSTRD
mgnify:FL=1